MNYELYSNFIDFIKLKEYPFKLSLNDNATKEIIKESFLTTDIYIKNLRTYLSKETFELLQLNLMVHFFITNPLNKDLYNKYGIEDKENMVSSVSAGGSSTSLQSFKSLEDGEFLMLDLNRTPYGRRAYSILESIKAVAII
ncbi:TPA: hypothetical protein RTG57_001731 [Campylobacter jejuni]|nr:hypothetical protein [Campylobacter jejuni]HDZ5057803.1 hypothetical protein [Campylobacter jejuni]